jgi:hypothetical protein
MAIVQVSQITNRLGLQEDLPQLAGGELGWSTNTRQLYIGNGTLEQGAPVIGNTEILTEFSDILNPLNAYTYKGTAAGYVVQTGPTPGTPITLTLQTWLDQYASVLDFGAVGDGLTDCTDAINRALFQLFCRQTNPQIRRSLFFPAGVYIVSGPINIPSYATLYGEGPENSIIQMVATAGTGTCVAQTADSLQQTGVNVGTNGATLPTDITIINMAFQSLDNSKNIFLMSSASKCDFRGVSFIGPGTTSTLVTPVGQTAGVSIGAGSGAASVDLVYDNCQFTGTAYGMFTGQPSKGVVVTNSYFNILYQGISFGLTPVSGGPTGTRINNNVFDNIYAQGIIFGNIGLNATGYNIFYDVGNHFNGITNPATTIISINGNNNVSVGDMFARADAFAASYPRVALNNTVSIATTNGVQLQLGRKTVQSGVLATLSNNTANATAFTVDTSTTGTSFKIDYSITRSTTNRTGTLWVASGQAGTINVSEDYTENGISGVTLLGYQTGTVVSINYITTNTSYPAQMSYSISYFN